MRDTIMMFAKVLEKIDEVFTWHGSIYKIVHITDNFWLVENLLTGRELKVI